MFGLPLKKRLGCTLVLVLLPLGAAGEEFHLKDGTKITGKIVGYEKDAFRVETGFGFALIYKNRVERILFAEGSPPASAAAGPLSSPPTSPASRSASPPPAASPPPPVYPVVEQVTRTQYVNQTYGFQLYKPPTWRSFPHLVTPQNALVAALGTPDESTLLLIGSESYGGDLAGYARVAERNLERLYQDYRNLGEERTQLAGLPALERSFSGVAEGRFWTGTAIYVVRGRQHFTLLGLISAGENTPFQETILRKVFHTVEFLP